MLFRQLYHSNTQAAAARVSLVCIGMQAVLDALICIAHLLLCAMMQPLFVALASVAFFKLVNFCIFEMRFLILVYQSRQPQSFFEGGWQSMRNELAVLHGRFYLALFATLAAVMPILVLLLYSFWVPQIVSNILRDTRHSLHPLYLFGISATRLVLPLYFYGCPANFLVVVIPHYQMHYEECVLLVLWVSVQVCVILMQDRFGPHFFIPARFLPQKYNYYRPVPSGPQYEAAETSETADLETGTGPECAICYNVVDPSLRTHMVTPCDHCFHTECLQQWINIKMECPTCRSTLPPT
ncbi:hypothetical protein JKP88DRAFT_206755 [Tribonema minus]|uniref:RING-type E3 ubiquitin transferase n=1 Tax=Tribonema minus TaxID=303371 RepID=A0A835Z9L2_9STRA|nr:hypothetical protein JKP88DRAFT_206755 [Tribonema minus]